MSLRCRFQRYYGNIFSIFASFFCFLDKIMLSDNVYFGNGPIQKWMITLNVTYLSLFGEWNRLDSLSWSRNQGIKATLLSGRVPWALFLWCNILSNRDSNKLTLICLGNLWSKVRWRLIPHSGWQFIFASWSSPVHLYSLVEERRGLETRMGLWQRWLQGLVWQPGLVMCSAVLSGHSLTVFAIRKKKQGKKKLNV